MHAQQEEGFSVLKSGKEWEKEDKVGTLLDIHRILIFSVVEGETLGFSFINTHTQNIRVSFQYHFIILPGVNSYL